MPARFLWILRATLVVILTVVAIATVFYWATSRQSLSDDAAASAIKSHHQQFTNKYTTDVKTGMRFIYIPGGDLPLGSPRDDEWRQKDEGPLRLVTIPPVWMAETEVTRKQFSEFVSKTGYITDAEKNRYSLIYVNGWVQRSGYHWKNPGFAQTPQDPVVHVSWQDAMAMAEWMGSRDKQYRLPTEPEWEIAARGGVWARTFWGNDNRLACQYANAAGQEVLTAFPAWKTFDCYDGFVYTAPVGSFSPNGFGLFDMLGNSWEWCFNRYSRYGYQGKVDRLVLDDHTPVAIRGGSWYSRPDIIRSARRDKVSSRKLSSFDIGFRLVMVESSGLK